ncbi:MAG: recombinase family protein [Clostridia bacterium]|nr:recombinase family protein [Clostridia bacterium]
MEKVAIYCRLSDEDKNKISAFDASESIQNQKNMLTGYAIEKNWEIFKIYSDDDYSGLDKDRPEWNQMLIDAECNKFDVILCKSQSRFARDMESIEKYLHNLLVEWGIRFVGFADNSDTANKGNKKQRQIMGLTNEWYCEDISENIRSVFDYKRKEGQFIGSFAAYGYKKSVEDKNKILIDEEAAKIVRQIFDWYLQGYGSQHIAYMLNEKEIYNPTKYKQVCQNLKFVNSSFNDGCHLWNKTTIKRILKNELYIGNMVQGKRKKISYKSKKIVQLDEAEWIVVKGTHQPIIDQKVFDEVQYLIKNRKRSSGEGKAHIFATKLRCADCNHVMVKNSTFRKGIRYSYFRCKLYAVNPGKSICTRHGIRLDYIEKAVIYKLNQHMSKYFDETASVYYEEINKEVQDSANGLLKEKNDVNKQLKLKTEVLKNLYEDKIRGVITGQQFIEMNEAFLEERAKLLERLDAIDESIKKVNALEDENKWLDVAKDYQNIKELSHILVNGFIDFIEVSERDKKTDEQKIKIYWRF